MQRQTKFPFWPVKQVAPLRQGHDSVDVDDWVEDQVILEVDVALVPDKLDDEDAVLVEEMLVELEVLDIVPNST